MRKIKAFVACSVIMAMTVFLWTGHSSAAGGLLYLSPSSSSVQVGSNLTLQLRINPGTTINSVEATISYDPSALSFISSTPSFFATCVQNSGGGGNINLSCASLANSTSSDTLVSTLQFQALAGSGSSAVTLTSGNAAYGTYTNPGLQSASVSFTSPAPPASSGGGSSSGGSSGTTSHVSHTSSPSSTQPVASSAPSTTPAPAPSTKVSLAAHVATALYTAVAISVKANQPVQAAIDYGTSATDLNLSTPPAPAATTSTVSLDPNALLPGTTYYYQVVATDASGNVTKGPLQTVTTKGFTVEVTVLDGNYRPLAHHQVTLHSTAQTVMTDGHGVATFVNVAPGQHHVDFLPSGMTTVMSQPVYVMDAFSSSGLKQTAATQQLAVILHDYHQSMVPRWLLFIPIFLVIGLLLFGTIKERNLPRRLRYAHNVMNRYTISQIVQMEQYVKGTIGPSPTAETKKSDQGKEKE